MTDDTITAGTTPAYPQQRTGPDGTTYWVDKGGQVFSPDIHAGPCDSWTGIDDDGRWVPRTKPRRGRPRKARVQPAPVQPANEPGNVWLVPPTVPARVWFVWRASTDPLAAGEPVALGAYTDAEQALAALVAHPGARVIEASVS